MWLKQDYYSPFFSADSMATVILQKVANPDPGPFLASLGGWKPRWVRGLLVTQGSPRPPNFSFLGSGHAPLILLHQEHKTEGNSGLIGRQKEEEKSWFFSSGTCIHLTSLLQRHYRVVMESKEVWIKPLNVKYDGNWILKALVFNSVSVPNWYTPGPGICSRHSVRGPWSNSATWVSAVQAIYRWWCNDQAPPTALSRFWNLKFSLLGF